MKVLHLCPLWFPVSRDARGGIETFIASLLPALARLGVESTIVASGDSLVESDLISAVPRSLSGQMENGTAAEYSYYEQRQLELAVQYTGEFDLIHSHIGQNAYILSTLPSLRNRVLHTVHSPVGIDLQWFVREHPRHWFSTVSEHQAGKLREAGAMHCQAIHNGIDVAKFTFQAQGGEGLFFIGRMEAVKGPDIAVRVAGILKMPLTLAGPIVEHDFFQRSVAPFLDDRIRYIGVVDHRQKNELFGQAACAILPFREEEPFGLVAIEAMACGTPVVALARGALPEIIESGVTGQLCNNENPDEVAALAAKAILLDRAAIRARVQTRFDITVSAACYRQLYTELAAESTRPSDREQVRL